MCSRPYKIPRCRPLSASRWATPLSEYAWRSSGVNPSRLPSSKAEPNERASSDKLDCCKRMCRISLCSNAFVCTECHADENGLVYVCSMLLSVAPNMSQKKIKLHPLPLCKMKRKVESKSMNSATTKNQGLGEK